MLSSPRPCSRSSNLLNHTALHVSLDSSDFFFFFCVTASSSIPVVHFVFKKSYNPPVYPSSVVPSMHDTSSYCAFNPSAPSGHELSTSLRYVSTRHCDTKYHRSHSPFDSHLNRYVLAATSLPWPVALAHHLVHLGNVVRRTCLLHSLRSSSTMKRLPTNYSSSLIGLFLELSSLPGSLVTLATFSLVLHPAALSPGCWVS